MTPKSHMEKVLREEGWQHLRHLGKLNAWADPKDGLWDYLEDAYRIALRRRQARERRELKGKGWICLRGWWSKLSGYLREDGSRPQERVHYTREEAIQLERGRG
jgi:hypothetical protein